MVNKSVDRDVSPSTDSNIKGLYQHEYLHSLHQDP